jgi:hypothetical protein
MQRIISPLWILAGLAFVTVLILLGADLQRAARQGPRWRRRLIAAALVALAGFGWVSPVTAAENVVASKQISGDELSRNKDWREIMSAWKEAANIANGKAGQYPFLTDGAQESFLKQLEKRQQQCDQLAKAGLLTVAEAGLLKAGLKDLADRCDGYRPKTMMMATCYMPIPARPAWKSSQRLKERLDILEKLAQQPTIQVAVIEKTLAAIEADLATLADEKNYERMTPEEKADAIKTRDAAAESVRKIKAKLPDELTETKEWKTITEAWKFCAPFAKSGRSTQAQRKQMDTKLAAAEKALDALVVLGQLSATEAELLHQSADRLQAAIYRYAPTDSMVTCYLSAPIIPAQESLNRLNQRLPLLDKLVTDGKLHPTVIEKLLPSFDEDLKILGDEKEIKYLPETGRAKARETRKQVEELLQKLRQ